jgi:signal transduction histidine kinase
MDELYDLTMTINELLTRIETSLIQQKQFTSDASHEIRTPIAAIRGTLEVLARKEREPRIYIEKISGIIKEVDRLDIMLDQLLHLSRIESDKTFARNEKINLEEVISVSMKKWEPLASEKNISQTSKVPEHVFVVADRVYLELIMDNLLSNAIKYGKEHGNVFFSWDDELKILAIQDDGIGISPEHLPNIFNRFYRVDESRSSYTKGNGLGLSIVKKLADLQDIVLTPESIPDIGTTFYLKFSL